MSVSGTPRPAGRRMEIVCAVCSLSSRTRTSSPADTSLLSPCRPSPDERTSRPDGKFKFIKTARIMNFYGLLCVYVWCVWCV